MTVATIAPTAQNVASVAVAVESFEPLLLAILSAAAMLLVAAIAYRQAKRITLFEAFFRKKTDAYENYLAIIEHGDLIGNSAEFAKWTRLTLLYCPNYARKYIETLTDTAIELDKAWMEIEGNGNRNPTEMQVSQHKKAVADYRVMRELAVRMLRDDIAHCASFKVTRYYRYCLPLRFWPMNREVKRNRKRKKHAIK